MFARILRFQTHLDKLDEVANIFEEQVIPEAKKIKGYKEAYFMADRRIGNCVITTMWETEEDLLETENSRFFQEQLIKIMKFFITDPVREIYEVLYKEQL
jgi:heme-degrading monooxygenase HmoA